LKLLFSRRRGGEGAGAHLARVKRDDAAHKNCCEPERLHQKIRGALVSEFYEESYVVRAGNRERLYWREVELQFITLAGRVRGGRRERKVGQGQGNGTDER
jgi:hypothetical protein